MADKPSPIGATFAEREAARLGKPMPKHSDTAPYGSTFAERIAARTGKKAVQAAENKAVASADEKKPPTKPAAK